MAQSQISAPRAVFADYAADHNREIGRTCQQGGARAQLLVALADAEGAHWFRVRVRFRFDEIVFDVSAEFVAKQLFSVKLQG